MRPDLTKAVDRPCVGRPARYNTQPFGEKAGISSLLLMLSHRPAGFSRKKQQKTERGIPVPKVAIAKTTGLVRRILAPAMLGAMLPVLSLLASADAEAQTEFTPAQVTVHISVRIRETETLPPASPFDYVGTYGMSATYTALTACIATGESSGETMQLNRQLNCVAHPSGLADDPRPDFLGGEPDYRASGLCHSMGGDVGLKERRETCSNIDEADTFCFVGAPEVFPCQGLYKNVLRCNYYNRPALNPFVCKAQCREGDFACGRGCWRADIEPVIEIFPIAPGHEGAIFWAGTTPKIGEAQLTSLSSDFTVGIVDRLASRYGAAAQVLSAPLPARSAHAGTLRADFSCGGLANAPASAEWAFTVTVLAAPPTATLYYESGAGTGGGGSVTINGIASPRFSPGSATLFRVGEGGEVLLASPRPASGESRTLTVLAHSPREFWGEMRLTVQAEFRHPFHPDLGAGHCKVPDNQAQVRRNEGCSGSGYCEALDKPMFDALKTQDGIKSDSDFCRALRNGADVNVLDDGVYPMAIAATLNRTDIGEVLTLSGATIHSNEAEYGDALNYAAYAGSEKFARWLIVTVGASVNAQSGSGNKYAPVHMLGLRNFGNARDSAEVARLLTLHNADLDAEVASGPKEGYRYASFLTDSRTSGEPDYGALSVLVSAGVNLAYGHPSGEDDSLYPLDRAAKHNLANVARVMLTRGNGIVNAVNGNGTTPIFHARTLAMVNLLISAGGDAHFIAHTSPHTPLDAMLENHFYNPDGDLYRALSHLADNERVLCLAAFSNPNALEVARCPNQPSCELPVRPTSDDPLFTSLCTRECPPGYGGGSWNCERPVSNILGPSGVEDYTLQQREQINCRDSAKLSPNLFCLLR